MASVTYAERIALDMALVIASETIEDFSRQRDPTNSENTTRTTRVAQMAASKIESRLGSAGLYDDTDATIGNQIFLEFGIRYAILLYSSIYSFVFSSAAGDTLTALKAEIEEYRATLIVAASTPVIGIRDNDDLNAPYVDDWESEEVTD